MQRALLHLPQPQREALILVGAGGFAYEEAAEICGCAVGTIKSRVARGRVALETLLTEGKLPSRREHDSDANTTALQTIMNEVDELSRDRDPAGGDERRCRPSVEPGEQVFELDRSERSSPSMREGLTQSVADAGMDGGRSHLHEAPGQTSASWPLFSDSSYSSRHER